MRSIRIHASRVYDVMIGEGLLQESGRILRDLLPASQAAIVSDDRVFPFYGEQLKRSLEDAGFLTHCFIFPHGEASKNLTVYGQLLNFLSEKKLTRSDCIIALGGGVTGDLAGFAAATFLRGIDYVQVPTSLLAAVDSSVGGKTAVDLPGGKNQAGAFCQPAAVLFDPAVLRSLPIEEYRAGAAEVIKYAVLGNSDFFGSLEQTPIAGQLEDAVSVCVSMKRDLVEKDEYDRGDRMLLNFGHTLGHAAELISGYTLLHGEAVAMGMAHVTRAAERRGICEKGSAARLVRLLKQYELPTEIPYPAELLSAAVLSDKKRSGSTVRLIVPERIGQTVILPVSANELPGWISGGYEGGLS